MLGQSAKNFSTQLGEIRDDIMGSIDLILVELKGHDLSESDLDALIIVEDFSSSHFESVELTRVDDRGELYCRYGEQLEDNVPYDMMDITCLLGLLEDLEKYYHEQAQYGE